MKRKLKNQIESVSAAKKQRTIDLSLCQKAVADNDVLYLLNQGEKSILKTELNLLFGTPKKMEALLIYSDYQIFQWALEHQDTELMQYIMQKTTDRGKFLVVCHNNYALLEKFIDLSIEKIRNGTYDPLTTNKILKILLESNTDKSYIIAEAVNKILDKKALDDLAVSDTLRADFNFIAPDFVEVSEEVPQDSSLQQDSNILEQQLTGKTASFMTDDL